MPVFAHDIKHLPDLVGFEQRSLVEEGIMFNINGRQRALDPGKHARFGQVDKALPRRVAQRIATLGDQIGRYINQVVALVKARRQLDRGAQLLEITQPQALAQLDHLRPGVVVIVFALDFVAGRFQQARHRIADHSAARMPDSDRPAGVGADELDLRPLPAAGIKLKQRITLGNDRIDLSPQVCLGHEAIDEARRRQLKLADEIQIRHIAQNEAGNIKWFSARQLRQAHRRIRQIALIGAFRRADRDIRYLKARQFASFLGGA